MRITPKELATALYLACKGAKDERQMVRNFVAAAKQRGLTALLPDVLAALPQAAEDVDSRSRVTVETAFPFSDEQAREALTAVGIDPHGRDVALRVDPELIGGIRIRTNDTVIDATVRRQMDDLRRAMTQAS